MRVTVFRSFEEAEPTWLALESQAHYHPFQSFAWLSAWHDGIASSVEPCITLIEDPSIGTLLLPLGIRTRGLVRVLTWLGGTVTDYHAPIIGHDSKSLPSTDEMSRYWAEIQARLPEFDATHFVRQPERIGSVRNPFLLLSSRRQDRAYAAHVGSNWETYQDAHTTNRARKRDRRYRRRLEDRGELRFEIARTAEEAEAATREVVRLKKQRFPEDPHLGSDYEQFYVGLARKQAARGTLLAYSLRLDDQILAAEWGLVANGRLAFLLSGYDHGELSRYSPGALLQRLIMEWCTGHGIPTYDFLLGNEQYKRQWATEEFGVYEHLESRSLRGRAYVVAQRLKRAIQQQPLLITAVRRLRRRLSTIGSG